ncbi:MAG TPA: hypothetical protein VLA76_00920 [Candidatus Angelobacter sp.]|nr:hypothetical protein [Candidatus Angelobacter sp.]
MELTERAMAEALTVLGLAIGTIEYLLVIRRRARTREEAATAAAASDEAVLRNMVRVMLVD